MGGLGVHVERDGAWFYVDLCGSWARTGQIRRYPIIQRNTNDPSARPQTAFLEATWETCGCYLGGILELEAEEASGRHLESKSTTSPKRNAKVAFNFQLYDRFLKVGVPEYYKLQIK